MFLLEWVDKDLDKAEKFIESPSADHIHKKLVLIRILRRKGRQNEALQKLYILKSELKPDDQRQIYQILLVEEQSLLFELGLRLELEEINDTIMNHILMYPFDGNEYILGSRHLMNGIILSKRGYQIKAIYQFLHAAELFELMEYEEKYRNVALCHNNVGYSYTLLGQINNAIHHYKISADTNKKYNPYDAARTYANLGLTYSYVDQYNNSINYLDKSLRMLKPLDNAVEESLPLFNLVYVHADLNHIRKAKQYLNDLAVLSSKSDSLVLKNRYEMAKAIVFFHKQTFQGQVKAFEIFKKLVEDRFLLPFYQKLAYSYLAEIIILEMISFGSKERLYELKKIIHELNLIAEKEKSSVLKINSKIIQMQLHIITGEYEKAKYRRSEIEEILEDNKSVQTSNKLSSYLNYILQPKWLDDENRSLAENIVDLDVLNILHGLREDQISIKMRTELPIMFLMYSDDAGTVQDRIVFEETFEGNEQLIASFLQAINLFFQDTLNDEDAVEQIYSREYSIYIQRYYRLQLAYISRGIGTNIAKKMTRIRLKLDEMRIWEEEWKFEGTRLRPINFSRKVRQMIKNEIHRDLQQ